MRTSTTAMLANHRTNLATAAPWAAAVPRCARAEGGTDDLVCRLRALRRAWAREPGVVRRGPAAGVDRSGHRPHRGGEPEAERGRAQALRSRTGRGGPRASQGALPRRAVPAQ